VAHGWQTDLANTSWKTLKRWQTRAFIRQTRVKSKHTLICSMTDVVQWHSREFLLVSWPLSYSPEKKQEAVEK